MIRSCDRLASGIGVVHLMAVCKAVTKTVSMICLIADVCTYRRRSSQMHAFHPYPVIQAITNTTTPCLRSSLWLVSADHVLAVRTRARNPIPRWPNSDATSHCLHGGVTVLHACVGSGDMGSQPAPSASAKQTFSLVRRTNMSCMADDIIDV
jgi:hypothetical protein